MSGLAMRPPIELDERGLRRLATTINKALGIKMPAGKLVMLQSRLQRRLGQLGIASLEDYERLLEDPVHAREEQTHLFDLATTNKTDFFREAAHFTYLTQHALPRLAERTASFKCRVWCAGCSTGQEAYTLAMVLADHARMHPGFDFEIVGTDVSTRVLQEAAAATYPAALVEPVPAVLRQRYVMRGKGKRAGLVRIVPELRAKVRFGHLNFMDRDYPLPGPFDVVFFRNVLIYFDRPTQQQVVARMCHLLRPNGYLFIAHTESLTGLDLPLTSLNGSILRRNP